MKEFSLSKIVEISLLDEKFRFFLETSSNLFSYRRKLFLLSYLFWMYAKLLKLLEMGLLTLAKYLSAKRLSAWCPKGVIAPNSHMVMMPKCHSGVPKMNRQRFTCECSTSNKSCKGKQQLTHDEQYKNYASLSIFQELTRPHFQVR
jgi:hypothetical protein